MRLAFSRPTLICSGPSLAVIGRLAAVEELTLATTLPSHANPSRPARIRRIRSTSVSLPRPADPDHSSGIPSLPCWRSTSTSTSTQADRGLRNSSEQTCGDKPATPRALLLLRRPRPHFSWLLTPVRYSSLLPGPHPPDRPALWECGLDLPPSAQVRPKGLLRRSAMFCLRRCVPIPPKLTNELRNGRMLTSSSTVAVGSRSSSSRQTHRRPSSSSSSSAPISSTGRASTARSSSSYSS